MTKKTALRQKILKRLQGQSKKNRMAKSLKIERALKRSTLYRRAKVVLCYVAHGGEVETRPILDQVLADGKRLVVPVTVPAHRQLIAAEIQDPRRDLVKGPYGIPHPKRIVGCHVPHKKLDLVIVPGVAFDKKGRRLGRGGGYFDRFLEKVPRKTTRIGLAFKFQVVAALPWESHDQQVHKVITE